MESVYRGMESVFLHQPGGYSAEILLYGGQVVSWKDEHGEELVFISKQATFSRPRPIRGGISIRFPQLPAYIHQFPYTGTITADFVRTRDWTVESVDSTSSVTLIQQPDDYACFRGFRVQFRLSITLGPTGDLEMITHVKNMSKDLFEFRFGYENNLLVSDISKVRVMGLQGRKYLERSGPTSWSENKEHQYLSLRFNSEVDRVYIKTPEKITINDHSKSRIYDVNRSSDLTDLVVWNPWSERAREMTDFGHEDYLRMLCVGPAAIDFPIDVSSGKVWSGRQKLSQSKTLANPSPGPSKLVQK